MARRLIWSPRARSDLREILLYIAIDAPANARTVARRMRDRTSKLPESPGQGRRLPEYRGDRDLREVFVHRWRVIYLVAEDTVEIVAIVHGVRLLGNADPLDV